MQQKRGASRPVAKPDGELVPQGDATSREERAQTLRRVRAGLRAAYRHPDEFHGEAHAERVAALVRTTARQLPDQLSPIEGLVLTTAALLHDVGYAAYDPAWSANRREHVPASLAFTFHLLPEIPIYARHPELVAAVGYLIAYHDDTSYKFPSAVWNGGVGRIDLGEHAARLAEFAGRLSDGQRQRLRLLLGILREADAVTAAGTAGAERTFRYALHRGLPVFAAGNALNAWCWEESAVGNTRLAAKRALIDAFTPRGQAQARASYRATEAYLSAVCAREGVGYVPEHLADELGAARSADPAGGSSLELTRYAGWRELEGELLASSPGDGPPRAGRDGRPALVRVAVDRVQAGASALPQPWLERLRTLHGRFLAEYALSLFDLAGTVEFRWGGRDDTLMPPIVAPCARDGGDRRPAVVDGLPCVALARELGARELWAVEVEPPIEWDAGPSWPVVAPR